jgi:hypothetical protein
VTLLQGVDCYYLQKKQKEQDTETKLVGMNHGAFVYSSPTDLGDPSKPGPTWAGSIEHVLLFYP